MQFPYLTALGPERGWNKVGPLARVQNCDFIHTPLAEAERQVFREAYDGAIVHAPIAHHWARLIELLPAAKVIGEMLHDDDLTGESLLASGVRASEGVGIIEGDDGAGAGVRLREFLSRRRGPRPRVRASPRGRRRRGHCAAGWRC